MKFNKAMVSSLSGQFSSYALENIVGVSFVSGVVIITYIDKSDMGIYTTKYDSKDVVINLA